MSASEDPTPMETTTEQEPEVAPEVVQEEQDGGGEEQSEQKIEAPVSRRRSGRSQKKVVMLNMAATEIKEMELPVGPGVKLGDIALICGRIDRMKAAEMILKKLYRICYGRTARKLRCKKDLRAWSGFDEKTAEADIQKRTAWMNKNCDVVNVLKPMLNFLDLSTVGPKDELIERMLDFLASPTDSGKEFESFKRGAKRKRSTKKRTKKSSKKSKKSAAPRKKSGYMVYLSEHRAEFREANPHLKMIAITQGLAKQWNQLDDDEKQEWKDKAAAMPAEAPKKRKTTKKKTASKKKSTKKKAKKKVKKRQPSSDEESSDDDEPLGGEGIQSRLDAAVKKIVWEGDLNTLTKKMVRKKLKPKFGEEVMLENKSFIKACMKKHSAEKMASS